MASLNRVTLIGNLGADPELRQTSGGRAVANLSLATNRSWKDKETGERMEEAEWHRLVFFDRLAEIAGDYLRKGRPVYIEGRLKTRKWQDKDGKDVYTTEVIVTGLQLLSDRDSGGDHGGAKESAGGFPDIDESSIPY